MINAADGVGVGAADPYVLVDVGVCRDVIHALPARGALVEHSVAVSAVYGVPSDLYALIGAFELRYLRSVELFRLIGVCPAGVVVAARELAVLINAADGVGVGAADPYVLVDVGVCRDVIHALPARGALVEHSVAVSAADSVPCDLDALIGALELRDLRSGELRKLIVVGVSPACVVVGACEVAVCVDAADGVGVCAAVADICVDEGCACGVAHSLPARRALVEYPVAVSTVDLCDRDFNALSSAPESRNLRSVENLRLEVAYSAAAVDLNAVGLPDSVRRSDGDGRAALFFGGDPAVCVDCCDAAVCRGVAEGLDRVDGTYVGYELVRGADSHLNAVLLEIELCQRRGRGVVGALVRRVDTAAAVVGQVARNVARAAV